MREECARLNGNIFESKCLFCPPGIAPEYGACTRKCGANQMYTNRVCVCLKGFTRVGRDCIASKKCGTNQVWSDTQNQCVCNKASALVGDLCIECPAGSVSTADGNSCFCNDAGKIFDNKKWTCKNRCNENE